MNSKPVGVIEAKKEGVILTPVEDQSERYLHSQLKWSVDKEPLRFAYESTGKETQSTDNNDPISQLFAILSGI